MNNRRQNIEWQECDKCGVGQLYCINDADDDMFYDGDRLICDDCGDVGHIVTDGDEAASISFDFEDIYES